MIHCSLILVVVDTVSSGHRKPQCVCACVCGLAGGQWPDGRFVDWQVARTNPSPCFRLNGSRCRGHGNSGPCKPLSHGLGVALMQGRIPASLGNLRWECALLRGSLWTKARPPNPALIYFMSCADALVCLTRPSWTLSAIFTLPRTRDTHNVRHFFNRPAEGQEK